MTWYAVFVLLRVACAIFVLLTSAYGVVGYSPFGFQEFIRPRVFAPVNQFVAWHHVWYCGVYLLSVISVIPDVRRARTRRLALGYIVVFGLLGEWMVVTPYLPKLWNDSRCLIVAIGSFVPLGWLAFIDHVATHPAPALNAGDPAPTAQRRLLLASVITAEYLWLTHLVQTIARQPAITNGAGWAMAAAWSLTLHATAFMIVYAVFGAVGALAGSTKRPRHWEYGLTVALGAFVIGGVLLRVALPTISFGAVASVAVSAVAGCAFALTWSGLALRRPYTARGAGLTAIDVLVGPIAPPDARGVAAAALLLLSFGVFAATGALEKFDWNNLMQKVTVLLAWALAFAFVLALSRRVSDTGWSAARAVLPPLIVLVAMHGVAQVSAQISRRTNDPFLQDSVALDRYASVDPSFRLAYESLVEHPGVDPQFYRWLQANTNIPYWVPIAPPPFDFTLPMARAAEPRPNIFLFVVDSLRPDYVSAYNSAVTFTPHLGRFAADSLVFRNAFTHYGGTSLAMPSIWVGGLVVHRPDLRPFHPINAIEKLLDADGYRRFVSLDTIMEPLLSAGPAVTELDADRTVMQFDLCHTLQELELKLTGTDHDPRPVFAYSLAQNLHISNVFSAKVPAGESYPGFFGPLASRLRRLDGCFGDFVGYLKRARLYDNSIIVFLSDHGDALGEDGAWGHGVPLLPQVVRIPLIIHVPDRLKSRVTADLTQVSFSSDIAPTLYQLTGHPPRDLGPLFGRPVVVPWDTPLTDDRRRESFLLVSSYAPTYAVLRRNGRLLYIADLVNGREYGYDLTYAPLGTRIQVTDAERRVNRGLIRAQVALLAAQYRFTPQP